MNTASETLSPRQARIRELEKSVLQRQDSRDLAEFIHELQEKGIPAEEFADITTHEELLAKFDNHPDQGISLIYLTCVNYYLRKKDAPSLPQKVLENIYNTRSQRARLLGEVIHHIQE